MCTLVTGEVAPGMRRSLGFVVANVGVWLLKENTVRIMGKSSDNQMASGQEKSGRSAYFSMIFYTHTDMTIYLISSHTNIL